MTAPYGSSFSSLDIHTTPRAQDEIYAKALHRTLYNWDSAKGKPVLELAKAVAVSDDGLVYTFKLRDDAFFHHGRKMTADDIIWTYTRIMDGAKAYPGARFVRVIKGAVEVEKGQAKEISGPEEDRRFHARNDADREGRSRLLLLQRRPRRSIRPTRAPRKLRPEADRPWAVQVRRARAGLAHRRRAVGEVLQARQALCRQAGRSRSWARPRRATSPSATRRSTLSILGPAQYVAYQADPNLKGGILEVAEVFTRHMGMNPDFKPFADKRVRQAINHAIDTDLIIKRLVQGQGLSRHELAAADLARLRQER